MLFQEKAYAKVNLFLDVLAKRPDGYHDIGTVFQTIDACDLLEAREISHGPVQLTYSIPQDYPVESDLVYRAAEALRAYAQVKQSVAIHLHKHLPLGAGLGGGSADAAAALRLLNRMWNLGLPAQTLCAIGAKLGADVPFLVEGGTAWASGIGDQLTKVPTPALPQGIVLAVATPLCAVPTKAAYAGIQPSGATRWESFMQCNCHNPLDSAFDLFNKFEESVLPQFPQIESLKTNFTRLGALRVLMSGSGASVFAFFDGEIEAKKALATQDSVIRWRTIARFTHHC